MCNTKQNGYCIHHPWLLYIIVWLLYGYCIHHPQDLCTVLFVMFFATKGCTHLTVKYGFSDWRNNIIIDDY